MKHFTIDAANNITLHGSRKEARETGASVFSTEEQFADAIGNDNQRLLEIWNRLPGVKPVTKFANRKTATERIWKAIQNLGGSTATAESETAPEMAAEPVAQPAQAEPAAQSETPMTTTEPAFPAAEQQPEPKTAAIEAQEPSVAPSESAAEPNTPFDETVAAVGAQGADVAPVEAKASKKANRVKKTPTDAPKAKATRQGSKTDIIIGLMKRPDGATLKEVMEATSWQAHSVRGFVSGMLTKKMGLTVESAKSASGERTYSISA